ncbi:hypothetical protein KY494_22375 [Janthinobacterium sp. PAMC25594]|nr:hypothetical protein KY494_22375 [Janthinobacterium sp. PAMC25594]
MRLILPSSWRQRKRDDVLQTGNGVTPELRAVATIPAKAGCRRAYSRRGKGRTKRCRRGGAAPVIRNGQLLRLGGRVAFGRRICGVIGIVCICFFAFSAIGSLGIVFRFQLAPGFFLGFLLLFQLFLPFFVLEICLGHLLPL